MNNPTNRSIIVLSVLLALACGTDPAPLTVDAGGNSDQGMVTNDDQGLVTNDDQGTVTPDGGTDEGVEPCGDGTVQLDEQCDTAITSGAGSCPASCADQDACTDDSVSGAACQAVCLNAPITACVNDDGCCASGCDASNDNDCGAVCENGVVEGNEVCDGNCPVSCDDSVACTTDVRAGSNANCDVVCSNTPISACVNSDGCCPSGCTIASDSDCTGVCGDGTITTPPETCEPSVGAGCPSTAAHCNDAEACTIDNVGGSAATCTSVCTHTTITACTNGDGCCAASCNSNNDNDCAPRCGNNSRESGEQCDDGDQDDNDGCTTNCEIPTVTIAYTLGGQGGVASSTVHLTRTGLGAFEETANIGNPGEVVVRFRADSQGNPIAGTATLVGFYIHEEFTSGPSIARIGTTLNVTIPANQSAATGGACGNAMTCPVPRIVGTAAGTTSCGAISGPLLGTGALDWSTALPQYRSCGTLNCMGTSTFCRIGGYSVGNNCSDTTFAAMVDLTVFQFDFTNRRFTTAADAISIPNENATVRLTLRGAESGRLVGIMPNACLP